MKNEYPFQKMIVFVIGAGSGIGAAAIAFSLCTHRSAFAVLIRLCTMRLFKVATLTLCFGASAVCTAQNGASGSQQTSLWPLAEVVKPYIDRHELAGAVILVADRDRVIDRGAVGYADVEQNRAMKPDDVFWIASMSKAITASAVMMLVDEGKIDLNDPVEKYLPEFKGQKVALISDRALASSLPQAAGVWPKESTPSPLEAAAHPITVREILSHTSGLSFSSKREPGALDLLPLKTAVESYASEPLALQPGQQYRYSNEGFNTAGRIVEVVSGMPFETFLQTRLLEPLGMNNTTFWPSSEQQERLAKSYKSGPTGKDLRELPISQLTYPLDDRQHRFPIPAGGLFSTADDIARFCRMMANNGVFDGKRYLSEESVRLMTSKETGPNVTKPYGFGWNIGDGYFEHSGAYKTDMKVDLNRGLTIIFLVQRADDWSEEDRKRLMDSLEKAAISNLQASPQATPNSPNISAEEQAGIDADIARHLGDAPGDPGPKAALSSSMRPAAVNAAVRKVADWELKRAQPYLGQNWTWSVLDAGLMAASRELNDSRYRDAMLAMAEKFQWKLGAEDPAGRGWPDNNDQALAQTYLELYFLDPAPEKIEPTKKALDSLFNARMPPVPEGQFPIWWQWCDTLFMGPPTWARMAAATHEIKYVDYLNQRWSETSGALYDQHYHLFYRDKTFMDRSDSAGKPIFWSRGNGWVMGGLARTLEYMPKDYPARSRYEDQLREMAAELASIQDQKTGLWHSDLLDPADYPQPEVSGSSLIAFGLAWGVNHGVLNRAKYAPVVSKAWRGLVSQIYASGRLGNVQQTDGAPNYYLPGSSYNFGVGAFLLAGEQVARLGGNGHQP